jgi:hypothetical protein
VAVGVTVTVVPTRATALLLTGIASKILLSLYFLIVTKPDTLLTNSLNVNASVEDGATPVAPLVGVMLMIDGGVVSPPPPPPAGACVVAETALVSPE